MYIDAQLQFSDAQALTSAAASTNLVDLGIARDIGNGSELFIVLVVDVALTDASSNSTVAVILQTDSVEGFGSPLTGQTLFTIAATAAVGTKYIARIQPDGADERYIRLYFTPANGDLTTGSVTAFITTDIDKYTAYANNITIS